MERLYLTVLLFSLFVILGCTSAPILPTACTEEAKVCPDGSVVGRNASRNCTFDPCQPTSPRVCSTDVWQCSDGSYVSRNITLNCAFNPCPVPTACTDDAKVCDDGSYVSRNASLNCEFNSCPTARYCDTGALCGVQGCYKFEDLARPICFTGDPCNRCVSGKCIILESFPAQVRCQPTDNTSGIFGQVQTITGGCGILPQNSTNYSCPDETSPYRGNVSVYSDAGYTKLVKTAQTGQDGRFSVQLEAGTYYLMANDPAERFGSVNVKKGQYTAANFSIYIPRP